MRALVCFLLACACLAPRAHAQVLFPHEALSDILVDANNDRVPDRLGETVGVAGRAVIDAGALGDPTATALASGARGVWVEGVQGTRAGDSLHVRGTLRVRHGIPTLESLTVNAVRAPRSRPTVYRVASGDLEAYENLLVRVQGTVASVTHTSNGGHAMVLALDDQTVVTAFAYARHPEALTFDRHRVGDRLTLTGLAGQYDNTAPFDATYQIYPRRAADIVASGFSMRTYQWLAAGALLLLLGTLAWATVLRGQVHTRMAEVRRSEAYYRALVRSASDAVFVFSIDGQGIEVNPAARAALGLGPDDPAPALKDIVAPEYHDRAEAHVAILRAQGSDRCDLAFGARGTIYEVDSHVLDLGDERRVLSLARDVGTRRAYEAELLEARREAEEMVRLKSAFLASMSHEIRTPLTAVIGFAELLHDEVDDDQKELTHVIEQGGRRLLRTLNSVLDLARLDSGAEALTPRPLDLVEHIRESVLLSRSMAEQKGVELTFHSPAESLPAMGDAGALDRIVSNLVGNAVKFTERGTIRVSLDASGDDAILSVSDTGIGIDERFLPDLFSEFRQESEGHGRSHEGTGLGLAITSRLVNLMDGSIRVESEKGVGTTFTIRLPRVPAEYAGGDGAFTPEAARLAAAMQV